MVLKAVSRVSLTRSLRGRRTTSLNFLLSVGLLTLPVPPPQPPARRLCSAHAAVFTVARRGSDCERHLAPATTRAALVTSS